MLNCACVFFFETIAKALSIVRNAFLTNISSDIHNPISFFNPPCIYAHGYTVSKCFNLIHLIKRINNNYVSDNDSHILFCVSKIEGFFLSNFVFETFTFFSVINIYNIKN